MAIRSSLVEDDFDATSLPTISEASEASEEDGASPAASEEDGPGPAIVPAPMDRVDKDAPRSPAFAELVQHLDARNGSGKDHRSKRKKRSTSKAAKSAENAAALAAALYSEDHDTAQQMLVDLCTEMKDLKASMQDGHAATAAAVAAHLASNQGVLQGLAARTEGLQASLALLDAAIATKATPEQVEELARIRAVQEMLRVVTDDKERTVELYEAHARRGYDEIERLREDLAGERRETARLRAELEAARGRRAPGGEGGPGAVYVGGAPHAASARRSTGGEFDDLTLETRGSYDTATYEVKSLKKRILHMKKKLTVAQLEAREAGALRSEAEAARGEAEAERRAGAAKDAQIAELEAAAAALRRERAAPVAAGTGGASAATKGKRAARAPSKKWFSM